MSAPEPPSYQELAALAAGLAARVGTLEAENAELRRRADRSSRERSKERKPGGQPGRKGSGLASAVTPDRTQALPPPGGCPGCGTTFGAAGTVVYGPNINAAAILLAGAGNVPIERTAMLMESLLSVPVSTGFVARALERFAQRLAAAQLDGVQQCAAYLIRHAKGRPIDAIHHALTANPWLPTVSTT